MRQESGAVTKPITIATAIQSRRRHSAARPATSRSATGSNTKPDRAVDVVKLGPPRTNQTVGSISVR